MTGKDSDKPGVHYTIEFDVAEMLERTFSSLQVRDSPLAKEPDRFTAVRLHLHPSDADNERLDARPGVVVSQLRYLASNEAGWVTHADWSCFFKPTLGDSSAEQKCESSTSFNQQMEEHMAQLEKKLSETESEKASIKENPNHQDKRHTQKLKLSTQQARLVVKQWGNDGYLGYWGRDGQERFRHSSVPNMALENTL